MPRKKQKLTLRHQLASIPMRNPQLKASPGETPGSLLIEQKLVYTGLGKILSKSLLVRKQKRYLLDGLGADVYGRIDGKKTLEQLIDEFADENKLTFFESRALLLEYLRTLMKRGLVVAGVKIDTTESIPAKGLTS
jgi:hypothetical protein